jgi:predicted DCC family thiol-disulfide oxidoreductase YuxK
MTADAPPGPGPPEPPERIFYDGHCGLCHRVVRFVLARDPDGRAFRFAPLHGPTFHAVVPPDRRAALPDTLVVHRADGTLLLRSDAVLHVLGRLAPGWRALARAAGLLPRSWRDAAYDGVARVRARLFRPPPDVCPVLPPELRARFDP